MKAVFANLDQRAQVTVLVSVHNRLALTKRCIDALRSGVKTAALKYVVVDDGSTDGTSEWLSGQTEIETIKGDGNLWFGGATDLGFRYILANHPLCSHVLILNNDTFVRSGGLDAMLAATEGDQNAVIAATYWTEDTQQVSSTGFLWKSWRGLCDVCHSEEWEREHQAGSRIFLPVHGVATTILLIPIPLLRRTELPDPKLHPHNRYDALFAARMRKAGARLCCSTECLADHLYGPVGQRPSVRRMKIGGYVNEALINRRSVWHLAGGIALEWEIAPNRIQAYWAIGLRLVYFFRQLAWVTFNSMRLQGS